MASKLGEDNGDCEGSLKPARRQAVLNDLLIVTKRVPVFGFVNTKDRSSEPPVATRMATAPSDSGIVLGRFDLVIVSRIPDDRGLPGTNEG